MLNEYRIENNEDVVMWFACDQLAYDEADELLKGYIQNQHCLEYVVKANDKLIDARNGFLIGLESIKETD